MSAVHFRAVAFGELKVTWLSPVLRQNVERKSIFKTSSVETEQKQDIKLVIRRNTVP